MQHMLRFLIGIALIACLAGSARAEDAYFSIPLKELKTVEGKIPWPEDRGAGLQDWSRISRNEPLVRTDLATVEGYLVFPIQGFMGASPWVNDTTLTGVSVVFHAPAGVDVTGRIYFPATDGPGMTAVKFVVPAASADAKFKTAFYAGKSKYYGELAARQIPGAAWFRYQEKQAAIDSGEKTNESNAININRNGQDSDDFSQTMDLFSGGRAISENLQLNRALFPRPGSERTIALDSIEGIDVRAMDWKPLIAELHPTADKLADLIPGDQHGLFFPSFSASMQTLDQASVRSTPVFEQLESSSQDAGTRERYRRQLCLPETVVGRLLGPEAIAEMAITGSDPYLRTGSDIAILFESTSQVNLHAMLLSTISNAAVSGAGSDGPALVGKGDIGGISFASWVSPARQISAYLATVDGVEVVTNSLVQIQRIADVRGGKSLPISAAPEYTFFRNRYPAKSADETAFAVLPDAAIRRWCSPRWRIADSRRTRAAAVMADFQARHAEELISGDIKPEASASTRPADDDLTITVAGVKSAVYGTLDFMTPIAELQMDKVTQAEANMYGRWRDTYQQNWSNYFDPIGASLSINPQRTSIDVSVVPLIAGSDYRQIINLSTGAKIGADTGDRHADLFHIAMSINRDSEMMKRGAGLLTGIGGVQIDPLGWIGPTVALYVDDDPIWQKAAAEKKPDRFFESHLSELPILLYLQSGNPFKLASFLVALHAFADSSAPGMTDWVPVKYGDFTYTKVTPSEQAKGGNAQMQNWSICYAAVGGALILSPDETALRNAIDRQAARAAAATQPALAHKTDAPEWLGENLCAQMDVAAIRKAFLGLLSTNYQTAAQAHAWASLPILNEWHRLFPSIDPSQAQQKLFQTRLLDPAGGAYVWNDALQTMESTYYGCPEKPKDGPVWPGGFEDIARANFGITFENQGLRARAEFSTAPAK